MFKVNCRVWCVWTYTTRALELPVVVKIKYDLNKNSSMFKLICHVWYAWTSPTHAPELFVLVKVNIIYLGWNGWNLKTSFIEIQKQLHDWTALA
jgi:hypothetical protein